MEYLLTVFLLLGCTGFVVNTPESYIYVKKGISCSLTCVFSEHGNNVAYMHNGKLIYQTGNEEINSLNFNHHKYQISAHDNKHIILTIRRVGFEDVSGYECLNTTSQAVIQSYLLIVIGSPSIYSVGSHMESTELTTVCIVDFAYSSGFNFSKETQAQFLAPLLTYGNNTYADSMVSCRDAGSKEIRRCKINLTLSANLSRHDDGLNRTCSVHINGSTEVVSQPLIVRYAVAQPSIQPKKLVYTVGDALKCKTNGNPPPVYQWRNSHTNAVIKCQKLTVTSEMKGHNNWTCYAENEPGLNLITKETTIAFTVEGHHLTSTTIIILTAAIVLLASIILLGFICRYRLLKKRVSYMYNQVGDL